MFKLVLQKSNRSSYYTVYTLERDVRTRSWLFSVNKLLWSGEGIGHILIWICSCSIGIPYGCRIWNCILISPTTNRSLRCRARIWVGQKIENTASFWLKSSLLIENFTFYRSLYCNDFQNSTCSDSMLTCISLLTICVNRNCRCWNSCVNWI